MRGSVSVRLVVANQIAIGVIGWPINGLRRMKMSPGEAGGCSPMWEEIVKTWREQDAWVTLGNYGGLGVVT
jgi:hypothetical protein